MANSARSVSKPAPHGRVVGRYLMYGQIGSGGTATVHFGRLRGQGGFARTVALKRLHAHLARDPYFASLFLSEARTGARISHPNVASLLDVVRIGDDELLLVMDYVHGETLAGLLSLSRRREEPIPARIASAVAIGALLGLHAAHEALGEDGRPLGLVHGDVSPHNVIVGADGTTRMLDFGVARAGVANGADCRVIGTLAYMAPERLSGASFDRRSDVFSAGVLLWEMLAMRRLFTGADGRSKRGMAQIQPPSSVRPEIPHELDAVVMDALRVGPEGRPASALVFARALEHALPPASSQEVADWLNLTAGARLRERAEELSRIERTSAPALLPSDDQDEQPTTAIKAPTSNLLLRGARAHRQPPEDERTLCDISPPFHDVMPAAPVPAPTRAAAAVAAPRQRRTLTPKLPMPAETSPAGPPRLPRPPAHAHDSSLSPPPPPWRNSDEYLVTPTPPRRSGHWIIVGSVLVTLCSAGAWRLGRSSAVAVSATTRAPDLARVELAPPPPPRPEIAPRPASAPVAVAATVAPPARDPLPPPAPEPPEVAPPAAADLPGSEATSADRATPPGRASIHDRVTGLNARALAAYGRLEPAAALRLLSFALRLCQHAGRDEVALTARTQVNLGVVLAGGFKQRGLAARHFRLARALDPTMKPTRDLSNPEIEAALREAGAYQRLGL